MLSEINAKFSFFILSFNSNSWVYYLYYLLPRSKAVEPGNVCDTGNAPYRKSFSLINWNLSRRSHHIPVRHIIVKSLHRYINSSLSHQASTQRHQYKHLEGQLWPRWVAKHFWIKALTRSKEIQRKRCHHQEKQFGEKTTKNGICNDIHSDLNAQTRPPKLN